MTSGMPRRIVFVKNIKSNFIEEAILILKDNMHDEGGAKLKSKGKVLSGRKDCVLKEAEDIINEYIKSNELNFSRSKGLPKPIQKLKINRINTYINSALFLSILILVFIVFKLL